MLWKSAKAQFRGERLHKDRVRNRRTPSSRETNADRLPLFFRLQLCNLMLAYPTVPCEFFLSADLYLSLGLTLFLALNLRAMERRLVRSSCYHPDLSDSYWDTVHADLVRLISSFFPRHSLLIGNAFADPFPFRPSSPAHSSSPSLSEQPSSFPWLTFTPSVGELSSGRAEERRRENADTSAFQR